MTNLIGTVQPIVRHIVQQIIHGVLQVHLLVKQLQKNVLMDQQQQLHANRMEHGVKLTVKQCVQQIIHGVLRVLLLVEQLHKNVLVERQEQLHVYHKERGILVLVQ